MGAFLTGGILINQALLKEVQGSVQKLFCKLGGPWNPNEDCMLLRLGCWCLRWDNPRPPE